MTQLIRLLEGAPEHSGSLPVSCQPPMEMSLLPDTVGGVDYLYKVSHFNLSSNSAPRRLAPYSLSSSVELKELERLLETLILHLKSTGLHLLSGHQEAGHRSHSISLLCLLQIYRVRGSPCCETFTVYVEEPHTTPKKLGIRTCSKLGIVWIWVPASLDLDVQLAAPGQMLLKQMSHLLVLLTAFRC